MIVGEKEQSPCKGKSSEFQSENQEDHEMELLFVQEQLHSPTILNGIRVGGCQPLFFF
jgi:hypothetical protein